MNGILGHLCVHIASTGPGEPGFEIRALAVWGPAHYLSVTEAPPKIKSLTSERSVQSVVQTRDRRLSRKAAGLKEGNWIDAENHSDVTCVTTFYAQAS